MVQRDYILPKLPVALPTTIVTESINTAAIGSYFQNVLNGLSQDAFVQDAVWRDSFIMTGTLRTFYSAQSIFFAWQKTSRTRCPSTFMLDGPPKACKTWVECGFTFKAEETPKTSGYAYVSVIPGADGKWKIWAMRTIMEQIEGQHSVDKMDPVAHAVEDAPTNNGVNGGHHTIGVNGGHHSNGALVNGNSAIHTNGFTHETTGPENGYPNGASTLANGDPYGLTNGHSNGAIALGCSC